MIYNIEIAEVCDRIRETMDKRIEPTHSSQDNPESGSSPSQ
jgi:hypothetical protein